MTKPSSGFRINDKEAPSAAYFLPQQQRSILGTAVALTGVNDLKGQANEN